MIVAAIAGAGVRRLWRRPLPTTRGRVALPGLREDAEILRDRWGGPHIRAANERDVFFAQGYCHAQDRLWQMDVNRRFASGRLAEVLGPKALDSDRFMRKIGLHRAARKELGALDAATRALLDSYTAGVNAFIERDARGKARPLEHRLLRTFPARWEPIDSLTVGRLIALAISPNWTSELVRERLIALLGRDAAASLEPGVWEAGGDAVPDTEPGARSASAAASGVPTAVELPIGPGASNSWVVDGSRSVTGKALLANDIHLFPQLPSIMYEAHLSAATGLDVAGATVPGVAGVVIGHNARIAWGVTASMADTCDLFIERIDPESPARTQVPGGWREGVVVTEEIAVKGRRKPWIEDVLVTSHGPVITPTPALPAEDRPLALKSVVLETTRGLAPLLQLNRARDWGEFRAALGAWATPGLSFVYADVNGSIGFQAAGTVPVRAGGEGLVPSPGWTGDHEWTAEVPFEAMPSAFNPPAGSLVTANHDIGRGSRHFFGREYASPARHERITELLDAAAKHSVESFRVVQADDLSRPARAAAGILAAHMAPSGGVQREVLARLERWDGRMTTDSVEAAVYSVLTHELARARHGQMIPSLPGITREEEDELARIMMGHGPHPLLGPAWSHYFVLGETTLQVLEAWANEGPASGDVVEVALARSVEALAKRFGDRPSTWSWGRLHTMTLKHALAVQPPLDRLLNVGSFPVSGNLDTVRVSASLPASHEVEGPISAYRFIADTSDWDNSITCIPGGQSGHRASPHYADQVGEWRTMGYHQLAFSPQAVARVTAHRLRLRPG